MKDIDTRFYNQSQSWHYVRIIEDSMGNKLKAVIRRNAYDNQSYAKCYKFDGNEWKFLNSMPIENCECQVISYVHKKHEARSDLFLQDSQTLFEVANKILNNSPD